MAFVKWVANADRHSDWTSELLLKDGTSIKMGVPIDLKANVQKDLEAEGRQFVSSSKEEFDEHMASAEVIQPPGSDVYGTAPIFVNAGAANQTTAVEVPEADAGEPDPSPGSGGSGPARGRSSTSSSS